MLAILAAFLAACYLFLGTSFRKEIKYIPYIYILYSYTAFFLFIFVLLSANSFTGYGNMNYIYILILALGPTIIGHSVLNLSIRYVPATIVSLAVLGEPIMTTVLAMIILGERLTTATMIGGVLILYGIFRAINSTHSNQQKIISEE